MTRSIRNGGFYSRRLYTSSPSSDAGSSRLLCWLQRAVFRPSLELAAERATNPGAEPARGQCARCRVGDCEKSSGCGGGFSRKLRTLFICVPAREAGVFPQVAGVALSRRTGCNFARGPTSALLGSQYSVLRSPLRSPQRALGSRISWQVRRQSSHPHY